MLGEKVTIVYANRLAHEPLVEIYLKTTTPPFLSGEFLDKNYLDTKVYVPKGTLAAYQAEDGWKDFWNLMEWDSTTGVESAIITKSDAVELYRYNANGQILTSPQKGLNIIRMSDGSTKKVLVK